jgi:hypothetical protein
VTRDLVRRGGWGVALVLWASLGMVATPLAQAESDPDHAGADRRREVVPEFDGYVNLSSRARLFVLADVAHQSPNDTTTGEVGIHVDYTLQPVLRRELREADWERNRYLWVRLGYRHLGNLDHDGGGADENRLLLETTARFELPRSVWLVNRLRLDFRNLDGQSSRRYRYRLGAEKEFTTDAGTPWLPYAQAEWFYDTRYDAWSRQRYQVGVEVELSKRWRIEPYFAYDKDKVPSPSGLRRWGLVFKYYR